MKLRVRRPSKMRMRRTLTRFYEPVPLYEKTLTPKVYGALRSLGQYLSIARRRRSFSLVELAARADISRHKLQNLERGHPNIRLADLADVLSALGLLDALRDMAAPQNDRVLGAPKPGEDIPQRVRLKKPR